MRASAVVLVLANLVPLYGVVFLRWDVFPVLMLFWVENVVVGVFNVLRMLVVSPSDPSAWVGKVFMIPFFCVHYGAFTAGHGMFVIGVFGNAFAERTGTGSPGPNMVMDIIRQYHLVYPVLFLAASHGFSFAANFLGRGEYRRVSLGALMGKPYSRVVILHVTIVLGAFLVTILRSALPALLLLIALKVAVDIKAHLREHARLGPASRTFKDLADGT
jgi:hypothetical protein